MRTSPLGAALLSAALLSWIGPGLAEEKPVQLKQASGLDKVEANCAACHSLDYIVMNSPFLGATQWQAEVTKMITAFGAPIDAGDAKIIVDYLTANYGD
jgi:sulfite dehydrogenase (cytochrome) subunit B